jgi:hypothetical protein
MTTALAIIGATVIILGAATKIPPAISALIRACIPVAIALHDLRHAISHHSNDISREHDEPQSP